MPTRQGQLISNDEVRITGDESHGKFCKHVSTAVRAPQSKQHPGRGNRMYDLTRSKSCSLHTSCIGESRIPSAQTSLDIGTPIEPKHPGSAPMAFKKMSSEELRLAKLWYRRSRGAFRGRVVRSPAGVWPACGRPSELASAQDLLCACCSGSLK